MSLTEVIGGNHFSGQPQLSVYIGLFSSLIVSPQRKWIPHQCSELLPDGSSSESHAIEVGWENQNSVCGLLLNPPVLTTIYHPHPQRHQMLPPPASPIQPLQGVRLLTMSGAKAGCGTYLSALCGGRDLGCRERAAKCSFQGLLTNPVSFLVNLPIEAFYFSQKLVPQYWLWCPSGASPANTLYIPNKNPTLLKTISDNFRRYWFVPSPKHQLPASYISQ